MLRHAVAPRRRITETQLRLPRSLSASKAVTRSCTPPVRLRPYNLTLCPFRSRYAYPRLAGMPALGHEMVHNVVLYTSRSGWPRALASFAPPAGVGTYAPPVRRVACSITASRRAAKPPALKGHLSTVASQSGRIRSPLKVVLAKARLHLDRLAPPPIPNARRLAGCKSRRSARLSSLRSSVRHPEKAPFKNPELMSIGVVRANPLKNLHCKAAAKRFSLPQ